MVSRTELDPDLYWLMEQTSNPAVDIGEVEEVFDGWRKTRGGFSERQKKRVVPSAFSPDGLNKLAVEPSFFFREGFYRLPSFNNSKWVKGQFEKVDGGTVSRWEKKAEELINKAGRYPSAYARRRLALLLVGAEQFPRAVPYRNFLKALQDFFYANCPDGMGSDGVERLLSGIVAEASFVWALMEQQKNLLIGNPRLDIRGVDFALPITRNKKPHLFLIDVKGHRGKGSLVEFSVREARPNDELQFPVIEVSIPTDFFGSSHRGQFCVCFPPTEEVASQIRSGITWILTRGREGRVPFSSST